MSFHSSSSIFDGFFSIPRKALCVPSFTSNDVTHVFHNKKLKFLSNFSTSNLVVVVVLLAITLIPIVMIFLQSNNRETPSWRLGSGSGSIERSTTSKQLKLNHHTTKKTQDLTWFDNVPTSTGRRGEIFIEEKYKSYNEISLTTLNGGILKFLLNFWHTFKRPSLRGLCRHLGWS